MQEKLLEKFKELFGAEGDIRVYFAPGRVNLMCFRVHSRLVHMALQGNGQIKSCVFVP